MKPPLLAGLLLGLLLGSNAITFADDAIYRYPFAKGTVEKLETDARILTVATALGQLTLVVTDRTYFFRGKDKIAATKLKVGDTVKLNYYTNEVGRAFVRRLKVEVPEPAAELPLP